LSAEEHRAEASEIYRLDSQQAEPLDGYGFPRDDGTGTMATSPFQFRGTEASTPADQASVPPKRLRNFAKPDSKLPNPVQAAYAVMTIN